MIMIKKVYYSNGGRNILVVAGLLLWFTSGLYIFVSLLKQKEDMAIDFMINMTNYVVNSSVNESELRHIYKNTTSKP